MNKHQIIQDVQLIQQSITDYLDMLVANTTPSDKELQEAIGIQKARKSISRDWWRKG